MKKWVKQLFGVAVVIAAAFLFNFPQIVKAENIFVEDNAGILSESQKAEIAKINQDFEGLEGTPQYVVVTLKNLDDYGSIEDYAEKKFKSLGIGNKELDNGFLFVIAIEDRKYRLEVGYGVEDVITDSMKEDIVTSEITDKLKEEDYGEAVMDVSHNIQSIVTERYSHYEASVADVQKKKEEQAAFTKKLAIDIAVIALVIVFMICFYVWNRNRKLSKVKNLLLNGTFPNYIRQNPKLYVEGEDYRKAGKLLASEDRIYSNVSLVDILATWIVQNAWYKALAAKQEHYLEKTEDYAFQLVFQDAVIQAAFPSDYEVSVFLQDKYLQPALRIYKDQYQNAYPIQETFIQHYIKDTEKDHKYGLEVAEETKSSVRARCRAYLHSLRKLPKRETLYVYLMAYYFLKKRDLSDPNLLGNINFSEQNLEKAYRYAKGKSSEIEDQYVSQAINDLDAMTLGTYMVLISSWGIYGGGSSSGGGGGSSFGGGSSGGGGFSGGW